MDLPTIENLLCFLAAAEQQNFARAAKERHITPAAFGQRIKQLEQQMGCKLFERRVRSVALTLEGHRLVPMAQETVRKALQCREVVQGDKQQAIEFALGTRFELGMSWVLPAVLEFQEEHPQYAMDLYFGSGNDLLDRLKQREVEAIITSAPYTHRSWSAEFLHAETYVFVAAPSLLQRQPFESIEDAQHHTLFDINESLPLTRYLTSATGDMTFAQVRTCGAGAAIRYIVLRGLGVAVLPEYMVQHDLQEGSLVRIMPDLPLFSDSFRLLFHRNSIVQDYLVQLAGYLRGCPLK